MKPHIVKIDGTWQINSRARPSLTEYGSTVSIAWERWFVQMHRTCWDIYKHRKGEQ